jgi:hypothetical protein
MMIIARIILLVFALVTVSHGGIRASIYHAEADHPAGATAGHEPHAHDHAVGLVISIAAATDTTGHCHDGSCHPESDHTGAHVHVACCGLSVAVLSSSFEIEHRVVALIDHPRAGSSLVLGDLRYPLLRPPSKLI